MHFISVPVPLAVRDIHIRDRFKMPRVQIVVSNISLFFIAAERVHGYRDTAWSHDHSDDTERLG
jgi:hypothetical protein